jgi:hypothetical protein
MPKPKKNKGPVLKVDECLVAWVESKKTGADVHEVASWLSLYECNALTYNRWATVEPGWEKMQKKDAMWCKNMSLEAEKVLRAFNYLGDIWKAVENVTGRKKPVSRPNK